MLDDQMFWWIGKIRHAKTLVKYQHNYLPSFAQKLFVGVLFFLIRSKENSERLT